MNTSSVNNHASAPAETPLPRAIAEEQRTLIKAVKAVNAAEMFGHQNEVTFVYDRPTQRMLVRVVNRETREIVNQIPSEYVIQMAEEMKGG